MASIHVDDVGTEFKTQATDLNGNVVSVHNASDLAIIFLSPTGTVKEMAATTITDGTDGWFHYYTVTGDIDEVGTWQVQGRVTVAGNVWHGDITKFKVKANLE